MLLENHFKKKRFGVATYFCFILKGKNKIRKKNPNVTPDKKDKSEKIESRSGGQVTYREGTVVSRSTPLSPYKNGLY